MSEPNQPERPDDGPLGDGDDELAALLGEALAGVAPLRADIATQGHRAFTWRTIDDDLLLAELSFDSRLDGEPAGVRSASPEESSRVLVFSVSLQSVEVEILTDHVVGQFVPPESGQVVVETEAGNGTPVLVDEVGFFEIRPVPRGMVRFRCDTSTTSLVSSWVRL